jgi:16S rRNA (cytosine1402-N4)-methyltransferase
MDRHESVMVREVVEYLQPAGRALLVDCTVGAAGHAQALLEAGASRLLGLDRDPHALRVARQRLEAWGDRVELVHTDYRALSTVLTDRGIDRIDGALADLGVSSMQLDAAGRGFSFRRDEPLDMRMDPTEGPSVADLLRDVPEGELADVIFTFGEERHSRRVARSIVAARRAGRLETTTHLAEAVRRAVPRRGYQRIDPATRTFQALRIWVNRELEGVDTFIEGVLRRLTAGARLVVLTFHSLEDRIVKHTLRNLVTAGEAIRILTPRPIRPAESEVAANPRARSAKLRAAERLN